MTKEEAKFLKDILDAMTDIPFFNKEDIIAELTKGIPEKESEWVELGTLEDGDKFQWNGYTHTVLDKNYTEDGAFILTDEIITTMKFNNEECEEQNNWAKSSLRDYLNTTFLSSLWDADKMVPFERDLTSDDGLKDYGTCTDKISLLTCDEYRKYRKFIDNKNDCWWTITPYSTPNSGDSHFARGVNTDGSLSYDSAFNGCLGVSPAYVLLSSKMVRRVSK